MVNRQIMQLSTRQVDPATVTGQGCISSWFWIRPKVLTFYLIADQDHGEFIAMLWPFHERFIIEGTQRFSAINSNFNTIRKRKLKRPFLNYLCLVLLLSWRH